MLNKRKTLFAMLPYLFLNILRLIKLTQFYVYMYQILLFFRFYIYAENVMLKKYSISIYISITNITWYTYINYYPYVENVV